MRSDLTENAAGRQPSRRKAASREPIQWFGTMKICHAMTDFHGAAKIALFDG
jgi:hypothetical protein